MTRFYAGKMLEIMGLVLLPLGLLYGMQGRPDAMRVELTLLCMGGAAFLAGWLLERAGGKGE